MTKKNWTTGELADLAEALAAALRAMPNVSVAKIDTTPSRRRPPTKSSNGTRSATEPKAARPNEGRAINRAIKSLSKDQIIDLIERESIDVAASPKDSRERLARRLAKFLAQHPDVAELVLAQVQKGSPDLARALRTLRFYGTHGHTEK